MIKFKIKPRCGRFYFNVLVFDTKQAMWDHCTFLDIKEGKSVEFEPFGAICRTYEIVKIANDGGEIRKSEIGTILFAKQQLGAGTIAHEIGHASFHYDRLINGNSLAEYGENIGESEERVLYLLAEMVSDCINKMYKHNVL